MTEQVAQPETDVLFNGTF